MKTTIFTTPIINNFFGLLARLFLRVSHWQLVGDLPEKRRFVLIGAPHTSNWDFALMLVVAFKLRMAIHWMGKDKLFPKPFAGFVQWMGGIAIDRSKANGMVAQTIDQFSLHDDLIIGIPPEGTRKKVVQWKTGFYHIAVGANVPIVLGFIDGARKQFGFGPVFMPTGNLDEDMLKIREFYADKIGINAENT
jgi:1-acyl-sn-glycerol-3-phosphate acyltransferase